MQIVIFSEIVSDQPTNLSNFTALDVTPYKEGASSTFERFDDGVEGHSLRVNAAKRDPPPRKGRKQRQIWERD
jgi:hypothetical protein